MPLRPKVFPGPVPGAGLARPMTFFEFQTMFDVVYYGEKNKRDYETDLILAMRLLKETTRLLEPTRKDRREEMAVDLTYVYAWSNAAGSRLKIDIETAMKHKYPGICSYCLREETCMCGTEHPKKIPAEEKERTIRRVRIEQGGRPPLVLRREREFHKRLYLWQHETEEPLKLVAHIAEEADEFCTEVFFKDHQKAADELADVVAWTLTTANRLKLEPFDEYVWRQFPYECNRCQKRECICTEIIF